MLVLYSVRERGNQRDLGWGLEVYEVGIGCGVVR